MKKPRLLTKIPRNPDDNAGGESASWVRQKLQNWARSKLHSYDSVGAVLIILLYTVHVQRAGCSSVTNSANSRIIYIPVEMAEFDNKCGKAYQMALKTGWHRHGTTLRQCNPMYLYLYLLSIIIIQLDKGGRFQRDKLHSQRYTLTIPATFDTCMCPTL